MYNDTVIKEWKNGRSAKSFTGNLHTDGKNLYSYALKIGYVDDNGRRVVKLYTAADGNFRSMTTSVHVSKAKSVADVREDVSDE